MRKKSLLPFLLVISMIGCCIEIDISVPSFPAMARYFATTEEVIQMTLSLNFLGFCVSALLYGPLSESWGRRKIMVWGALLFFIGGTGCAMAQSIGMLIALRFFQGLGASASATVAFAMIADAYQGEKAARLIGMMNSVLTAAMAGAPVLGGFINEQWGWRANYTSVALVALVSLALLGLLLPETKEEREPFRWRKLFGDYQMMLTSPRFLMYNLAPTLLVAGYFSFVAVASFLYVDSLGLSVVAYSLHQGAVVASFSVVSFVSGRIAARLGNQRCVATGVLFCIAGSFGLGLLSFSAFPLPTLITLSMCLFAVGVALCYAPIFAATMEIYPEARGAASSFIMSLRMLACSATISIVAHVYNGTLAPTAIAIIVTALLGGFLSLSVRKELVAA